MLLNDVVNTLAKRQKGSFTKVCWKKNIESAAARKMGIVVEKETTTVVRFGVEYSHTKRARLKEIERAGEPKRETTPWYKHHEETPYILINLKDPNKTYIQLFPVQKKGLTKVKYYINGVEKTKKEVQESGYVNQSTFKDTEELLVMSIATENIQFIGGKK